MGWMPGINWWKRNGEVEKIFAAERKGLMREVENYNVEDASAVILLFESGFGNLNLFWHFKEFVP